MQIIPQMINGFFIFIMHLEYQMTDSSLIGRLEINLLRVVFIGKVLNKTRKNTQLDNILRIIL